METTAKRFNFVLPDALGDRLKSYANTSGLTQSSIIKTALLEYLATRGY